MRTILQEFPGLPEAMLSRMLRILSRNEWEGTAMMISWASGIDFSMALDALRVSGKGTLGRKRAFRRWELICSASEELRAIRLTGIFFRATIIPRAVPQVVVPMTATVPSKA